MIISARMFNQDHIELLRWYLDVSMIIRLIFGVLGVYLLSYTQGLFCFRMTLFKGCLQELLEL